MKNKPDFSFEAGIRMVARLFAMEVATGFITYKSTSEKMLADKGKDFNIYDTAKYKPMKRDYLESVIPWQSDVSLFSSEITPSNENTTVLQTGLLPTSEPKLAQIGDKKILVWLRDNSSRNEINRTELVYSIYDNTTNTWSEPKSINDDKTADFYPQIAYDKDNIFLVWQNIKNVLDNNVTVEDIAKNSEIKVSKFDNVTNTFKIPTVLSNNNILNSMPSITTKDGNAFVTWTSNTSNDVFGTKGTNNILSSEYNGITWTTPKTLVSDVNSIISIDKSYSGSDAYVEYSVDMDKNSETIADQEVFIVSNKTLVKSRITSNEVVDSKAKLIDNNGVLGAIWYSNNSLVYTENINNSQPK